MLVVILQLLEEFLLIMLHAGMGVVGALSVMDYSVLFMREVFHNELYAGGNFTMSGMIHL